MDRRIFITSDWHFCHNRDFLYEPRGFSSVYEMNEAIIKNHNDIITRDDIVYCLGDCMLNDNKEGLNCIRRLKGEIHIILGNHDTDSRIELYEQLWNIELVKFADRLHYKGYNFLLTHYPTLTANHDDGKTLSRKTINLCGHSHTADPFTDWDKGVIYHCELDAHNNKPILIDDIIKDIKEKEKK